MICLAAGAVYSLYLGQDANGDALIAHTHAAWTLLHPDQDPALDPSAWIPGTVNVPWLLLAKAQPAWFTVAFLGAVHATTVWLVGLLAWRLFDGLPRPSRLAVTVLSASFCVFGAATRTEFGTTFSDLVTAAPILLALILLTGRRAGSESLAVFAAGLLLGAAMGLKLTNLVFVLATVVAVTVVPRPTAAGRWRSVCRLARRSRSGRGRLSWIHLGVVLQPVRKPHISLLQRDLALPICRDCERRGHAVHPEQLVEDARATMAHGHEDGYPSERLGRDARWAILATVALVAVAVTFVRKVREPTSESKRGSAIRLPLHHDGVQLAHLDDPVRHRSVHHRRRAGQWDRDHPGDP